MSAKEMFEALGYELERFGNGCVEYFSPSENVYIYFWRGSKKVEANFDIDVKVLQAINQQCKELGWLDE